MHDDHIRMEFMGRWRFETLMEVLERFWMNGVETLSDQAERVTSTRA